MRSSETTLLLAALKRIYKAAGIRYADIAQTLGVSELTIKRQLSGKGLKLDMLARLCEAGDVTLYELMDIARRSEPDELPPMTGEQCEAIGNDVAGGTLFELLMRGWTASDIAAEFAIDEAALIALLARLDKVGLIMLFPGNRVRLLRTINDETRATIASGKAWQGEIFREIVDVDFSPGGSAWVGGLIRLSHSSFVRASSELHGAHRVIQSLSEETTDFPAGETRWYTMFSHISPIDVREMLLRPVGADVATRNDRALAPMA